MSSCNSNFRLLVNPEVTLAPTPAIWSEFIRLLITQPLCYRIEQLSSSYSGTQQC